MGTMDQANLMSQVIVDKMLDYLRACSDDIIKGDVVRRIGELAERFAPDTQWFIDTMNQVGALTGSALQRLWPCHGGCRV